MRAFEARRSAFSPLPALLGLALLAGCAGGSQVAPLGSTAASQARAVQPNTVFPPVMEPGPATYVYRLIADGVTDPTGGAAQPDAASFNAQPNAFGSATPPPVTLMSRSSTFGGSAGNPLDVTQQRFSGMVELSCNFFAVQSTDGYCPSAQGGTKKGQNVHAFAVVQSWPFYVGDGASSNLTPGTYTFETTSADGSYIVLAPASTTYAQPGDFAGTSGLSAGTALVSNGGIHAETSLSGGVSIGAQTCANAIYWATFEYFYGLGGDGFVEYSWQPPGLSGPTPVTQDVLWGQIARQGVPVPGEAITITTGGTSSIVTSDAGGCYGFNLPPAKGAQKLFLSLVDGAKTYKRKANMSNGAVRRLDFNLN